MSFARGINKELWFAARLGSSVLLALQLAGCADDPSFVEKEEKTRFGDLEGKGGEADAVGGSPDDPEDDPRPIDEENPVDGDPGNPDTPGSDTPPGTDNPPAGPDAPPRLPALTRTIEASFASESIAPSAISHDLASPDLNQEITLRRNYVNRARTATQITRRSLTDTFTQGNAGMPATEFFLQAERRPLDIAVVIDNSNSMSEEQVNLSTKLSPLLSFVATYDWQIGVVTTDPAGGCLRRLIRKGDTNAAQAFSAAVTAGVQGSSTERGILQAVNVLEGACLSQPWVRTDSTVAVLIVSDEDNCSNGAGCANQPFASASYLTDYLGRTRQPGVNARVYGIIWHPSQEQAQCSTARNRGTIYAQAIAATSGTWGSICDADYSATLSAMSQNIAGVLARSFTLRDTPDTDSLRVFFGTQEVLTGWTRTGKVVTFDTPPADGVQVTFSYSHSARPINNTFTLRQDPLEGSLGVSVNNSAVGAEVWTYDSASRRLTFTELPAERAAIRVTYKENLPLNTEFALGEEVRPGSLVVRVNGAGTTAGWTLVNPAAIVRFSPAPPEGANLRFEYVQVGDPILAYPFAPVGGQARQLRVFDTATGAAITAAVVIGFVTIAPGDWQEDRRVTLRYRNPSRDLFTVMLPHTPVGGSVVAVGGGVECAAPGMIDVSGQTVRVNNCGFPADVTRIDVEYEYVAMRHQEFVVDDPNLPASDVRQEWTVLVNGSPVASDSFSRDGNQITFAAPLPERSMVRVVVRY